MNYFKQNLGLDVDSTKLKASLQKLNDRQEIKIIASRTFFNTIKGFKEMQEWLSKKALKDLPIHVTMEATGVYYENVAYFFHEQENYIVHVLLPNKSAAYMKSLNVKSKTDEIDAQVLGRMGLERKLADWNPGSDQMRSIKKLVRERLRIQKLKTMISNQLHSENSSHKPEQSVVSRCESSIKFFEKQIKTIETKLKAIVKKDKPLQKKINNVCTAPGVAFVTAIGLVAETDGFALFKNRKQLVSYAGYDVVKNESGTSIRGKTRISKKGNSFIRQMLFMPGMSATTHNEALKKLHIRVASRTRIKMKGNVAVQRKLLLLVYTLFKNNTVFDPLYQQKLDEQRATERKQKKQLEAQSQIKKVSKASKKNVDHIRDIAYSG